MTMKIEIKILLLAAVLASLNPDCVAQNCDNDKNNFKDIAVYEGSPASFTRLDNGATIIWKVHPSSVISSDIYSITNRDVNVVPGFVDTYAANKTNLIIFNSTVGPQGLMNISTAGMYRLHDLDTNCAPHVNLVVIQSGPVITCNTSDPNSVKLSCSVVYASDLDSGINPIMTWKNDSGAAVKQEEPTPTGIDVNNPGLQSSVSQLSIAFNDTNTYECQLTFSESVYAYSAAENASIFTASSFSNCSFATTTVPYQTTNPTTTVDLNCSGQSLPHTVVYEGKPAAFSRLDNGQSAQWKIAPSSVVFDKLRDITHFNDALTNEFVSSYAVNQSQLTIFKSTVAPHGSMLYSTAGLYILKYLDPNCTTAANLIVIERGPLCCCNASNRTDLKLSCSLFFAESVIQPCKTIFTWKNGNGLKVKEEEVCASQIDAYVKRSQSQFSIAKDDRTSYKCHVSFGAPDPAPLGYVTSKAPDFTASCSASCA